MNECYRAGDFARYFDENMRAVGMPPPTTLYEMYQNSIANAALVGGTLNALGKGATMTEVAMATTKMERWMVAGSVGSMLYVGASIGGIAVATGRSFACGASMADVIEPRHPLWDPTMFRGRRPISHMPP